MSRVITFKRTESGFSLLEVLIAVVILATGLLALAALQGALARNSADAKARSRMATLVSNELDRIRSTMGYNSIVDIGADGAADAFVAATCTAGSEPCDSLKLAESEGAVTGLTLSRAVIQYAKAGTDFAAGAPAVASDAQFKLLTLEAKWKDATGADRSLTQRTVLSALALETESPVVDDDPGAGNRWAPIVRQTNPAGAGMIPIAIGDNTDTAATNPRPEVAGKSENQMLPATRFEVLTYQNESSQLARIQRRVETTVVQCTCKKGDTTGLSGIWGLTTYRPTYWDGAQYTIPEDTQETPTAGPYSGKSKKDVVTQSDLCTECCRDHHDEASTDADYVRYSNLHDDFNKYQATVSGTSVQLALANNEPIIATSTSPGNTYIDACRLIRVDGLWRVATDMISEHSALLATSAGGVANPSALPTSAAAATYEDFVINYLEKRAKAQVDSSALPSADTLYASPHNLEVPPDKISIKVGGVPDNRDFLHARSLYVDHIEKPLADKLAELKNDEVLCPKSKQPNCFLPYLPFNTVNVTELANWTSSKASVIGVTTGSGSFGDATSPIRGGVESKSNGEESIKVAMGRSNSAVASSFAIGPEELKTGAILEDQQVYIAAGNATTDQFFVNLVGLPQTVDASTNNDPLLAWGIGADSGDCYASIDRTDTDPNAYSCTSWVKLLSTTTLKLAGYNLLVQREVDNPCGSTFPAVQRPVLQCNTVSAVSVPTGLTWAPSVQSGKTQNEVTTLTITGTGLSNGTIGVTFVSNGEQEAGMQCEPINGSVTGEVVFTPPTACP